VPVKQPARFGQQCSPEFDWRHDHVSKFAVVDESRKFFIGYQNGGMFGESLEWYRSIES
jgi:hypothetical protein